jgi:hypothetical protein
MPSRAGTVGSIRFTAAPFACPPEAAHARV